MTKLLGFAAATVVGWVGWWAGEHVGVMTAFFLSTVGTGIGMYAGVRFAREHLGG